VQHNLQVEIVGANRLDVVANISQRAGLCFGVVVVNVIDNFLFCIAFGERISDKRHACQQRNCNTFRYAVHCR